MSSQAPREAYVESNNQVMLLPLGKDSSAMLRLTEKTFYPSKLPWLATWLTQAENEDSKVIGRESCKAETRSPSDSFPQKPTLLALNTQKKIAAYNLFSLFMLLCYCGTHVLAQPLNHTIEHKSDELALKSDQIDDVWRESSASGSVRTRASRIKAVSETDETINSIRAQILVQTNVISMEGLSLAATVLTQAAGTAASIATGGIGGPLVSAAVKATTRANLVNEDATTYLPVDSTILNEIVRFSECFAVENDRKISSVHLVPSAAKYAAQTGWGDYRDILPFLETHLEMNDSWTLAEDTDELIWIYSTLEVPEGFSFKTLADIRFLSASGFTLTLKRSTGEIEISEMETFQKTAYTKIKFSVFLNRFLQSYIPQMPHPECGTRSKVLRKLSAEIDQDSTLSELEQFFRDLEVSYERDRSKRKLIGIMRPSAEEDHGIDFPVKIELSYTRRPRRFDRALISNFSD